MQSHSDWLSARKLLLRQIKRQVERRLHVDPSELSPYRSRYSREFSGRWNKSDRDELQQRLLEADIVLGGDFHVFAQAQRAHLRILRSIPKSRKIVLALECFESKDQSLLEEYMLGHLPEAEFLQKIAWERRWGFAWSHYKPLLDWARRRNVPVKAVNKYFRSRSLLTLKKRDRHVAKKLLSLRKKNADAIIYTVIGDYHLAKTHLAQEVLMHDELSLVRVFLNAEALYFRLADESLEGKVDVMRGGRDRFCVLSSPPWVKWQSYLIYLDKTFDEDLIDQGLDADFDFTDHVSQIASWTIKQFKLKLAADELSVYTPEDPDLWARIHEAYSEQDYEVAEAFMANDRSFFLPVKGLAYLSRFSVNHSCDIAGEYIQAKLSGRKNLLWDQPRDFLPRVWVEALVFFLSLQVNHKRKSESVNDLKKQLESLQAKPLVREALLLALQQKMREALFSQGTELQPGRLKPRNSWAYFEATRILGHMLGRSIYECLHRRRGGRALAKKLLSVDVDRTDFEEFYYRAVRAIEARDLPQLKEQGFL